MTFRAAPNSWGRGPGRMGSAGTISVAAMKAAVNASPATAAAVGNIAGVTVSYVDSPDAAYNRYWFSGAGINNGGGSTSNPRLNTIADCYNFANWDDVGAGDVTCNQNDGSKAVYWVGAKELTIQTDNPCIIGFTTNSRYLWIPSRTPMQAQIEVNGQTLATPIQWSVNNQCAKIDFGTAVSRNIRYRTLGNVWCSEICISDTATIAPYTVTTGRIPGAFLGDSYMQNGGTGPNGLPLLPLMARLMGIDGYTCSTIGGTGYYQANAGSPVQYPNAQDPTRQLYFSESKPKIGVIGLGINDPQAQPLVQGAIVSTLTALRQQNPSMLMVVISPWCPDQSAGENVGGKYQQIRTWQRAALANISGPWIYLDGLAGGWYTSAGTQSQTFTGPWQLGPGTAGTTTTDGTHPTDAEVGVIINKLAAAYKAAVNSMP